MLKASESDTESWYRNEIFDVGRLRKRTGWYFQASKFSCFLNVFFHPRQSATLHIRSNNLGEQTYLSSCQTLKAPTKQKVYNCCSTLQIHTSGAIVLLDIMFGKFTVQPQPGWRAGEGYYGRRNPGMQGCCGNFEEGSALLMIIFASFTQQLDSSLNDWETATALGNAQVLRSFPELLWWNTILEKVMKTRKPQGVGSRLRPRQSRSHNGTKGIFKHCTDFSSTWYMKQTEETTISSFITFTPRYMLQTSEQMKI